MSDSGGSVDQWASKVAVDIGVKGQRLVLVLSLDDAALGSANKLGEEYYNEIPKPQVITTLYRSYFSF